MCARDGGRPRIASIVAEMPADSTVGVAVSGAAAASEGEPFAAASEGEPFASAAARTGSPSALLAGAGAGETLLRLYRKGVRRAILRFAASSVDWGWSFGGMELPRDRYGKRVRI